MAFLLCSACSRHVKGSDAACPFCGAATTTARRMGNPSLLSVRDRHRLLFGAITAAVAGAAAMNGCSDGAATVPAYGDAGHGGEVSFDSSYGGPSVNDASDGTEDASTDETGGDGGTDSSSGDANDLDGGEGGG